MILTKKYFILQLLFLGYLLHMSCPLQCKTCEKDDPACLLGDVIEIRDCISDDALCYSWFNRLGSQIGVQRGCISPRMAEYKMIKNLIGDKDNACIKRVNGLDCFKFCEFDQCN